MAAALDPTLRKKEFHNWLKGAMSVLFAKEGLSEFVQTEITDFQNDLINTVLTQKRIPPGTKCASCTTANVLSCPTTNFCNNGRRCNKHDKTLPDKRPNIQCLNNLCNGLKDGIRNHHRYNQPSWKNSDASKWCVDSFEVAKCFMPPDGYSDKRSLADTDFNGTISLIINNKRFQNKMTTQLNMQYNTCSKARDIINETIRHSGSNELSDVQLSQCIDALRDILRDSKCLLHDKQAQDAVNKLNQLQNNTLVISAGDITRALEENIRDCLSQQQQETVQTLKKFLDTAQTASVAALEFIKSTALDEIRKTADDKKQEILSVENKRSLFGWLWDILTFKEYRLKSELKEELINFYSEREFMIPASPLVEEYTVPLTELYVQPPMSAFIKPVAFGQGNKPSEKTSVSSYRELFLNDDNVPYKNIYVEANAGYGKTSFTQKIALTWCQAQKTNILQSLTSKFKQNDVNTLKRFDILFLLHLRDFQGEDVCNLDDLISKFVWKNLPGNELFSKQFIEGLLRTKTCLVIFDGLDEWVHPETCARIPGIPHNNYRERCTQLTTTRPWKLGTISLTPNLIDRHLVISMLDDKTSKELKSNAVKLLSENSGESEPDLKDFDSKLSSVKLGDISLIPFILLQLICIWFDGLSFGKSKCETYSNSIELTLGRGLKKKNIPILPPGNEGPNVTIPECIRYNALCKRHLNLLLKLGKLAFYTLFQGIKESSLVIERSTVLEFLSEDELEFCLKIGLLSQTRDTSKVSVKRYKVFFQHKSVHEFMAALYITSEWNSEPIKSTILKVCTSLSSILEMENLFVFVCGMNPVVYECISSEFQKIVDIDGATSRYRTLMYRDDDARRTMKSYQSMQVQCFLESERNGNDNCSIYLHDILIDKDRLTDGLTLKKIINFNKGHVKSLLLSNPHKITVLRQSMEPGVFNSLETLSVNRCDAKQAWLADILTESASTLKCLTLGHKFFLSNRSETALTGLKGLQSLYLGNVQLSHHDLLCFYEFISRTRTLTHIELVNIKCSEDDECEVTLDLHRLNNLKILHLNKVPCKQIKQVDGEYLVKQRIKIQTEEFSRIYASFMSSVEDYNTIFSPTFFTFQPPWEENKSSSATQLHLQKPREENIASSRFTSFPIQKPWEENIASSWASPLHLQIPRKENTASSISTLYPIQQPWEETIASSCASPLHLQIHVPQEENTACSIPKLFPTQQLWEENIASSSATFTHRQPSLVENTASSSGTFLHVEPLLDFPTQETPSATLLEHPSLRKKETASSGATVLQYQSRPQIFPELTHLHNILEGVKNEICYVPPAMTNLERVELHQLSMSFEAWTELFISVGQLPHPVIVQLDVCQGPNREGWEIIVDAIKSTPSLSQLQYDDDYDDDIDHSINLVNFRTSSSLDEVYASMTLKYNSDA